jgi:hypothetical protein
MVEISTEGTSISKTTDEISEETSRIPVASKGLSRNVRLTRAKKTDFTTIRNERGYIDKCNLLFQGGIGSASTDNYNR